MTIEILFFVFGSMIGSFLNVLIYRIPRGEDFVKERSHCPGCGKLIRWYQNIPIISFIFLRGKCEKCGFKIPLSYPLVELSSGLIALGLMPSALTLNELQNFFIFFSIACCFLSHLVIDLKYQLLPNKINLYLGLVILVHAIWNYSYQHWLLGGLIGFGFPYGVTWLFLQLRGVEGMGGGDIKLYGVLGLMLGPLGIIQNIFLSCFLGSIVGGLFIVLRVMDMKTRLAFGPFILVVASFQIFFPKYYEKFITLIL